MQTDSHIQIARVLVLCIICIIPNDHEVEATQMPADGRMDEQKAVRPDNGTGFGLHQEAPTLAAARLCEPGGRNAP